MTTDNQASAGEELGAIETGLTVSRTALTSFIEYCRGMDDDADHDPEFSRHVNVLTASELSADDALLASAMRKVLADEHGWVDFAAKDRRWQGPAWMTIDVRRVELTDEEYAAIERADQS